STGKPSSLLCETLDTFASTRSEDQVRTPHQAPTLIGCWFLKIGPQTHSTQTTRHRFVRVAASAAEKRDYADRPASRQDPSHNFF
ncbi:hypothetical protein, partial [Paraburkholderia sp. Ac-20336]|uniref:hypothetical protein n=1 Tax=Paraburkholderia sp. Ac-20336 TaxID=2703886 RepID=UPI0019821EFC